MRVSAVVVVDIRRSGEDMDGWASGSVSVLVSLDMMGMEGVEVQGGGDEGC